MAGSGRERFGAWNEGKGLTSWGDVGRFILPSKAAEPAQGRSLSTIPIPQSLPAWLTPLRTLGQESCRGGSGKQEAAHAGSVGVQSFSAPHVGGTLILCHLEHLTMRPGSIHFSAPADITAPQRLLGEVREGKAASPDLAHGGNRTSGGHERASMARCGTSTAKLLPASCFLPRESLGSPPTSTSAIKKEAVGHVR